MSNFLLGLASFGLVLVPLVIIHEFGHFIAAKLVGITVLEFGIGFPPRARILFTRNGTMYTLNWLPIGGFVRPYGEDFARPKSPDKLGSDEQEIRERGIKHPKSVFQATPWERMVFLAAGPGINLLTALLLFVFVGLIGQPFARANVTVYDIQPDSPANQARLQQGDVIVSFNGHAVDSADQFNALVKDNVGQPVTLVIDRNGQQIETKLVPNAIEPTNIERVYVESVQQDMPASAAGFKREDLITAVDGNQITSVTQLQDYTKAHNGEAMTVTVQRGTQQLDISVVPKEDADGVPRIGIGIAGVQPSAIGVTAVNRDETTYTRALGPGAAIKTGVDEFVNMQKTMVQFVRDVIAGRIALSEARPVSPVGIGQIGAPVFKQSLTEGKMYPIVLFAALISIALAITNLLPIPGLDGGRILFVVIELIRGKPMEPEREGLIHLIGVMLLLGIIFITVINDIVNPINIGSMK
ncbi:MAG TPA: RIP metalloprotease RseP [Aggregatilineaceae bacterium]|nr:RIP metalloprotease RseP [Aggregatilineaceae bacterium]